MTTLNLKIVKRDGSIENYKREKIIKGLSQASNRSSEKLTDDEINLIIENVELSLEPIGEICSSSTVYSLVTHYLNGVNQDVIQDFLSFNKYKDKWAESFSKVSEYASSVLYSGDKENANKDTALNSTKQAVISEATMKELMRTFELEPDWVKAHDEGWIHIHDLGAKFLNGINCCLFDMSNLLKGGFEINGLVYREPNSIQTAFNVMGDVTLSASGNQFGLI